MMMQAPMHQMGMPPPGSMAVSAEVGYAKESEAAKHRLKRLKDALAWRRRVSQGSVTSAEDLAGKLFSKNADHFRTWSQLRYTLEQTIGCTVACCNKCSARHSLCA